jgi:hypothetical protein
MDRVDVLLLVIGLFSAALYGLCYIAHIAIFGQATGIFAIQSFSENCQHRSQQKISLKATANNTGCPLGIELNSYNYSMLHK